MTFFLLTLAYNQLRRFKNSLTQMRIFIAVAKNLRGFGKSLYRRLTGDRIWTLLCQTAYNLKKLLPLYRQHQLSEDSLRGLGIVIQQEEATRKHVQRFTWSLLRG